jgi:hypothetical protein
LCLFATIRWLAGGSYLDIAALLGVSVKCFYSLFIGQSKQLLKANTLIFITSNFQGLMMNELQLQPISKK